MSKQELPWQLENLLTNLSGLSQKEKGIYRAIQKRSMKQRSLLFVYGITMMGLGIAATWLAPPALGNILAIILCGCGLATLPVFWNPPRFLPFKVTRTAPATVYRWKTRQAPEWLYRGYKRVGFTCLLYGDALIQEHPESKEDL